MPAPWELATRRCHSGPDTFTEQKWIITADEHFIVYERIQDHVIVLNKTCKFKRVAELTTISWLLKTCVLISKDADW